MSADGAARVPGVADRARRVGEPSSPTRSASPLLRRRRRPGAVGLLARRRCCCAPPTAGCTGSADGVGDFTDMVGVARRRSRRAAARSREPRRRGGRRRGRRVDAARGGGASATGGAAPSCRHWHAGTRARRCVGRGARAPRGRRRSSGACSPTSAPTSSGSSTRAAPIRSRCATSLARGQERARARPRVDPATATRFADAARRRRPARRRHHAACARATPGSADVRRLPRSVRIAAFGDDDRPGYGLAAEARGGWAARHDPPRLGRSSVADPVAGLLGGAVVGRRCCTRRRARARERVSLEGAVGHLLGAERAGG